MLTKKDLQDFGEKLRKEFKEEIETAIVQILESISKVVATKEDLKELATKEELREVKTDLQEVKDSVDEIRSDVRDIKRQINDLKIDTPTPQELADHGRRIKRLETAVFPS